MVDEEGCIIVTTTEEKKVRTTNKTTSFLLMLKKKKKAQTVARELAGVVDGGEDVLEKVEECKKGGVETKAVVVLREGVETDADSKGASEEEGLERSRAVASLVKLWSEPGKLREEGVVHRLLVLFDERRDLVLKCRRHLLHLPCCLVVAGFW